MKRYIVTILLLSHSFLAMAGVTKETKEKLLNFVKENAKYVGMTTTIDGITSTNYYIDPKNLTVDDFYTISRFNFSDSNITYLPNNLYLFENLRELWINNTNIEEIPKEFSNMYKSWFLYASNAKLKNIPAEVFEGRINVLDAPNNQIEYLPDSIDDSNIYYLNLSNNQLKELPKNFSENIKLHELYLNNNQLKSLPNGIVNLTGLIKLYLNDNQIEKLPKDFFKIFKTWHYEYGTLMSGAFLHLENNKISFFDKSICESSIYQDLIFANNYIEKLPSCLKEFTEDTLYKNIDVNHISTIYGDKLHDYFNKGTKYLVEQAGWQFAEDIIIYYKYEYDKTIQFEPIYQIDMSIESYIWNFGDGNTSTEETPTYTYQNYGEYNITLTINNDTTFSKLITISPRVLELKKGWNMITPPTKDDINATLFDIVWSYQNEIWENNHSYLIPTLGYWVKLNEDLNYSYNGEVYKLPNYKIKSGWNFVGSGEKYYKNENQTIYQYKNSEWIINPSEIKRGEGFWIKK